MRDAAWRSAVGWPEKAADYHAGSPSSRQQRLEVWTLPLDGSAEASRLVAVEGSLDWRPDMTRRMGQRSQTRGV